MTLHTQRRPAPSRPPRLPMTGIVVQFNALAHRARPRLPAGADLCRRIDRQSNSCPTVAGGIELLPDQRSRRRRGLVCRVRPSRRRRWPAAGGLPDWRRVRLQLELLCPGGAGLSGAAVNAAGPDLACPARTALDAHRTDAEGCAGQRRRCSPLSRLYRRRDHVQADLMAIDATPTDENRSALKTHRADFAERLRSR